MSVPTTTLIIPAFDEADRLAAGFARLRTAAAEGRVDLDDLVVIYVDDGSTDDTATVAASLVATLPHGSVITQGTNRGKGAAVRAGVASASTRNLIFTDADMAIDPRQIPTLLAALDDAPISVGSRTVRGHIDYGSWVRTRAGRSFNRIVRSVSAVELRDTQCGFKGISTAHAKILFALAGIDGFAFDVEILSRARLLGWSVTEVPVSWSDVGGSHVRLARDSISMLRDLLGARLRTSHLPSLPGLDQVADGDLHALAASVANTPLQAAPVLCRDDGTLCLLAPLVKDADGELSLLASRVGGQRLEVGLTELASSRVQPALA